MACPREHIHRGAGGRGVAPGVKQRQIPGQRARIAGDVYDPVWLHAGRRVDDLRGQALSGRVHHDDLRPQAPPPQLIRRLGGVSADEFTSLGESIALRVFQGVFHRVGNDLGPDDPGAPGGHAQADGARAAVEIQRQSAAAHGGVCRGFCIQLFRLGRIPGVERPALAPLMPNGNGHFLLIDCGANVDCKPEYLVQFGIMGDAYMRGVMGMENPRIGLVNIGAEAEKGNALVKETYPLMEKAPYNFIGNVEARDVPLNQADVCVTDGFGGNLILKYTEGLASALMGLIKKELMADTRGKIAGLIAKPAFRRVKKAMSSDEIGGAPLLGVQGAVIKAHGSSNDYAFCSAIKQCVKMIDGNVVKTIEENVTKLLKAQEENTAD